MGQEASPSIVLTLNDRFRRGRNIRVVNRLVSKINYLELEWDLYAAEYNISRWHRYDHILFLVPGLS